MSEGNETLTDYRKLDYFQLNIRKIDCIRFSKRPQPQQELEIGRSLFKSERSPFLNKGITFVDFHSAGETPDTIDLLKRFPGKTRSRIKDQGSRIKDQFKMKFGDP